MQVAFKKKREELRPVIDELLKELFLHYNDGSNRARILKTPTQTLVFYFDRLIGARFAFESFSGRGQKMIQLRRPWKDFLLNLLLTYGVKR